MTGVHAVGERAPLQEKKSSDLTRDRMIKTVEEHALTLTQPPTHQMAALERKSKGSQNHQVSDVTTNFK